MDMDLLGASGGPPFTTPVLEVADQLLLLGVHRDYGLAMALGVADPTIDVFELLVSVGMAGSLLGLPIGLQTVPSVPEDRRNRPFANPVTLRPELLSQLAGALACPTQRGFWVPSLRGFDQ